MFWADWMSLKFGEHWHEIKSGIYERMATNMESWYFYQEKNPFNFAKEMTIQIWLVRRIGWCIVETIFFYLVVRVCVCLLKLQFIWKCIQFICCLVNLRGSNMKRTKDNFHYCHPWYCTLWEVSRFWSI